MGKISSFILLLISSSSYFFLEKNETHAIYISVVEIQHKTNDSKAQLKIKVFKDDLQSALRNAFPDQKIAHQELVAANHPKEIQQYFHEKIKCKINSESANFSFNNHEKHSDSFWLIFEMDVPQKLTTIHLQVDFFTELFPNQSNIIYATSGTTKRFARLTRMKNQCEFSF